MFMTVCHEGSPNVFYKKQPQNWKKTRKLSSSPDRRGYTPIGESDRLVDDAPDYDDGNHRKPSNASKHCLDVEDARNLSSTASADGIESGGSTNDGKRRKSRSGSQDKTQLEAREKDHESFSASLEKNSRRGDTDLKTESNTQNHGDEKRKRKSSAASLGWKVYPDHDVMNRNRKLSDFSENDKDNLIVTEKGHSKRRKTMSDIEVMKTPKSSKPEMNYLTVDGKGIADGKFTKTSVIDLRHCGTSNGSTGNQGDCVDGALFAKPLTTDVDVRKPSKMDEEKETALLLDRTDGRQYDALNKDGDNISTCAGTREVLPPEELMYQMRFAFINKGFEVDVNVERTRETVPHSEQAQFRENILENLRHCPIPMRQKLNICRSLRTSGSRRYKQQDSMQYATSKKSREYSKLVFMLWEGTISKLSAYFGSNVASYFYFLRFLLYLNFIVAIVVVTFVTVPQVISGDILDSPSRGHFGDLSGSLMFYGVYTNEFIGDYNEPLAYLLTWSAVSLFSLIVIVISMQVRYRRSKLTISDKDYEFAWRTFCSWDYSVTSKDGVKDRLKSICTEMTERIREEKKLSKGNWLHILALYIGRLLSNILVFGLLGGSGYLIYYIAEVQYDFPEVFDDIENFFKKYQLSAIVAVLKLLVPQIFRLLAHAEGLKPRNEQKLLMARTTMFYFASLAVFIVSLYDVATGCVDTSENAPNTTFVLNEVTANRSYCCWENQVGEEVFKVVLIDFGLFVAVGIFFHVLRAILVACGVCCKVVQRSQFDVPSSVLDLIYGQGLVWLGLYFSPLLVAVGFAKLIIVFYFRYFVARTAMIPPSELFRASRSGNFYLFLLLLTWFLCLLPIAYAIAELPSSWDCGPFRDVEYAYELISDYIGQLPVWLEDVLYYIGTPAVEVPIIMLLILIVLYYKSRSSSYEALVKELRNQLIIERKVERRKVFARAISAPVGSVGKVTGSNMSLAPGSVGRASALNLPSGSVGRATSTSNMSRALSNTTFRNDVLDEEMEKYDSP